MKGSFYEGNTGKTVEVPPEIRNAAQILLEDKELFDRVDANNDNLLGFEEMNVFASTNEVIGKIFNI